MGVEGGSGGGWFTLTCHVKTQSKQTVQSTLNSFFSALVPIFLGSLYFPFEVKQSQMTPYVIQQGRHTVGSSHGSQWRCSPEKTREHLRPLDSPRATIGKGIACTRDDDEVNLSIFSLTTFLHREAKKWGKQAERHPICPVLLSLLSVSSVDVG